MKTGKKEGSGRFIFSKVVRILLYSSLSVAHPDYFVKLDFEIAVDQQTKARDRTIEGVPDSG